MPVCIAGMHRSGTSMVAKMLHTSGLYLGPESELMPNNPKNPEGHWENKRFVRVNTGILEQLHGWWDSPPPPPEADDWTGGRFAAQRNEAEDAIAAFASREPWGWKDPRTCLTLPFWQSLLGPLHVVVVVRNPLEVALSLRKRNGYSVALGLALWHVYNQRLWEAAASSERIVTHYDMYSRDPATELSRLLRFLGQSVDEDVIDNVRSVHDAELRHHAATIQDLRVANVAPGILELYRTLCEEANLPEAGRSVAVGEGRNVARAEQWQDSDVAPAAGRSERRSPASFGRPQRRRLLEEAEARIAELERTVEAQRIALAQYEADAREAATQRQQRVG